MLLQAASVLIVEHQPRVVVPLVRSLSNEGAYVAIAPNAREAFNLCRRGSFDIVITNSGLPDASIDVFIRAIRAVDSATVIVVTDGSEHQSMKSHAFGADFVLSKPIDPASVLAFLRNYETRRAA
jgi:DNA-binding response OmpR family regulator